jgi:hypothetical protein
VVLILRLGYGLLPLVEASVEAGLRTSTGLIRQGREAQPTSSTHPAASQARTLPDGLARDRVPQMTRSDGSEEISSATRCARCLRTSRWLT